MTNGNGTKNGKTILDQAADAAAAKASQQQPQDASANAQTPPPQIPNGLDALSDWFCGQAQPVFDDLMNAKLLAGWARNNKARAEELAQKANSSPAFEGKFLSVVVNSQIQVTPGVVFAQQTFIGSASATSGYLPSGN